MAVLDRLCIRGIRSFGPERDEKVRFSTPLTLFLGQNGCGKTTIIECLKYALTGDLPAGTDSGKGFVNDPKLSHKNTTKAYVKLKFRDGKGEFITVGKFVEVSIQAGGKPKFKSLNPSIRWENDRGEIRDISGRCADIDLYCSQKLNVSKAILNNVIFCHQENSAWPLEEAKKLKEKFDEIFGASEYNKCVEKLRKLIREKKASVKVLKEQFELKTVTKKNTEKLRDSLSEQEARKEKIEKLIDENEQKIEPLQKMLNEINELVDTLSATYQKITGLETTRNGIREQQDVLKKHLEKEYEGTDEELENEIINFHSFQEEAKRHISEKECKKNMIDSKIEEINHTIQRLQVSFGQLKQEETQHTKRCEELKGSIAAAKDIFNIAAHEPEPIPDILHKLETSVRNEESNFSEFCKKVETREEQLQKNLDYIRDRFAAAKENHSSKSQLVIETNKKISDARLKLGRLTHSNTQLEAIDRRIKDKEEALRKKKIEFDDDKELRELEELDAVIIQKDQTQNILEREQRTLQQNILTEQKIDTEKNIITEKRSEVANLKEKHQNNFETLFGPDIPQEKIEEATLRIQKREEDKVKNLTKNITTFERKVASLESSVKHMKDKLQSHENELKGEKEKIASICKGQEFSEALNESYIKKEKLQKEKGAYRSAKTLFEQFISQFERETPCCPICATDFSSKKSVIPNIISTLKRKIEDLPRKLSETEILLKNEESIYNKLQQLEPVSKNITILEEVKIPLLQEELEQNSNTLEESQMSLLSLKNDLVDPQSLLELCKKVIYDATLIDRLNQELQRSEKSLDSLRKDLVTVSSNRNLLETETELRQLKAELSILRRQYKTKRDLFDETKESMQRLNGELQSEIQKKLEVQKLLQEQPLLEKQIQEYKSTNSRLEEEKSRLSEKIAALKKELDDAECKRNEVIRDNKKNLEEHRSALESHKRLVDDIMKLNNVIQRYEKSSSKNQLEHVLKELETCKSNIVKLEETKKLLSNTIVKRKEELASQESRLRSLNDNKDLRLSRAKSIKLECEIQKLQKQIGNHNSKSICDERRKVITKIDSIQSEISRRMGERDTVKELIHSYKQELNKKEHKEAITEYKKKYYEKRVEELAITDLENYTEALEKSILKFHQERMVQINMTIRELWRNIYKGNDIDYIEIQTVDDIGCGGKRRSYNYKVVQVKKGTELEMRGRCSAGQKVLACLVIRMALAETFSSNCGILALDEPTTNLDRDNIMSLSDALSRIITAREKQKNFQLLIITHDEEFLQTLTRDQSVSHYYRVQRNANGFSEIMKQIL